MRAKTRSGQKAGQMADELAGLIQIAQSENVSRYLEVGARYGDTLYDVVRAMPAGSMAVAVDLPGNLWGTAGSQSSLMDATQALRTQGYNVTVILADSTDPTTVAAVDELGPYDLALIDGDHRYQGVLADWTNYGPLARMVAFHDIVGVNQRHDANNVVEVTRLWAELRQTRRHREIVANGSTMGIGVLWNT